MITVSLLLLVLALIAFIAAAAGVAAVGRVGLVPAGLAMMVAAQLIGPIFIR